MSKIITYDDSTDEITIKPGLFKCNKTVIKQQDFLNICSDFAFHNLNSPDFEAIAWAYLHGDDKIEKEELKSTMQKDKVRVIELAKAKRNKNGEVILDGRN